MTNTTTNTTTTEKATTKTQNNGWEKIAKKQLTNAYNWLVGEVENGVLDGHVTEEEFKKWIQEEAFDYIYSEAITTGYHVDMAGGKAPKEMRFATKEFCYKYLAQLFQKDGYTVNVPELEPKKAAAKKTTKTAKTTKPAAKTAKKTTIIVVLKTFTGMVIGNYEATLTKTGYKIVAKSGKVMEFNADGTQKVDCKNPKFNNRIEIVNVTEA